MNDRPDIKVNIRNGKAHVRLDGKKLIAVTADSIVEFMETNRVRHIGDKLQLGNKDASWAAQKDGAQDERLLHEVANAVYMEFHKNCPQLIEEALKKRGMR